MNKNKEMIEALNNLKAAFKEVDKAWDRCEAMSDAESTWMFPFGKSFDEVRFEVEDWVDVAVEELGEN